MHKYSHNYIKFVIFVIVIAIMSASAYCAYIYTTKPAAFAENFEMVPFRPQIEGPYGLGFQKKYEPVPLFVNFIPPLLGSDFKLNNFIRRTKMESNTPTITNGDKRSLISPGSGSGQISVGPARNPLFLVPDIGASRILVKWAKPATLSAKKVDAYGSFQETTKWSCKDTEPEWQLLWFPKDKKGLSRYCWEDLVKTNTTKDSISNGEFVSTMTDMMGSMDFETDVYNTFIEAMYALSYVQGSSLFGAGYDHRLIADPKEFIAWSKSLKLLIENSVQFNKRRAILTGHGLGALLTNKFLVGSTQEWKDTYIAGFISLNGTFGSVPKALRVLMSGEILPNKEDQTLIRNGSLNASGLHLLLDSGRENIVHYNQEIYTLQDIPKLLDTVSEELFDPMLNDTYSIAKSFNNNSTKAPNVPVNIFIGNMIDTEVEYYYSDLIHDPVNITYTDGDGTVPITTLVRPKDWSKEQSQIVTFKAYPRAEHSKILKLYEPMFDLMSLIKVYNE